LCWLRKLNDKFLAGTDAGTVKLHSFEKDKITNLYSYVKFSQLTSLHINSDDRKFVVSGFSNDVCLYDVETGVCDKFPALHEQQINVVKFANHDPNIFATSSFDKGIKLFDLRAGVSKPVFSRQSDNGNVMVCFSYDDKYILSSAINNEVRQYNTVDGSLDIKFDIQKRCTQYNYTRSYYLNGRDYIIVGSCEESSVRIYSALTGKFLRDVDFASPNLRYTTYCQSLRGDPLNDFNFSVLLSRHPPIIPSTIISVNFMGA